MSNWVGYMSKYLITHPTHYPVNLWIRMYEACIVLFLLKTFIRIYGHRSCSWLFLYSAHWPLFHPNWNNWVLFTWRNRNVAAPIHVIGRSTKTMLSSVRQHSKRILSWTFWMNSMRIQCFRYHHILNHKLAKIKVRPSG